MRLYHGSNCRVEFPLATYGDGSKGKDFGLGFYLTAKREMARNFAKIVVNREHGGFATVSTYDVRLDSMETCNLSVKVFDCANKEWFVFVARNRLEPLSQHLYDLIIGPVADKRLSAKLTEYQRRRRSGEDIDLDLFAQEIEYDRFDGTPQYCFASQNAIRLLKFEKNE